MAKSSATKTRPVHEVRLGRIKAAVWENPGENGARYNVTFTRIYKTDDGWQDTGNFGRDDLLLLAKVANEAHSWIFQHQAAEASEAA